jgi:ubiquinone/menaquinone biosynthesis C-methylase UbiE
MSTDAAWLDSMPEVYDRHLGPVLFEPFAVDLSRRAAELRPRKVLEIAAGTGVLTSRLVQAVPGAEVHATDLNPAMVGHGLGRVPSARWQPADATDLPYAAETFDLVVCQFGVMFFLDKYAAFAEMHRVLRPGGRLLFSSWDVVETSPFPAALVESLAAMFPADPPSFVVRIPHGYADPERMQADLEAAGFEDVSVERLILHGHAPSAASLGTGFALGTPLRFALRDLGPLDELAPRLAHEMSLRLGEGPVDGDLAAFVVSARTGS